MTSTTYVQPDSVLARTAAEMVAAHAGGAGPHEGMLTCPVCGEPLPCGPGRAAAEVLSAAGLAFSSRLVEEFRQALEPVTPGGDGVPDVAETQVFPSLSGLDKSAPADSPPSDEPAPSDEIDPLLLGPPLTFLQNRPLDAPRFTPSAGGTTME